MVYTQPSNRGSRNRSRCVEGTTVTLRLADSHAFSFQLVLVETQLKYDRSLPYKGELVITVPFEPGRITFSIPIDPTPDVLQSWETSV